MDEQPTRQMAIVRLDPTFLLRLMDFHNGGIIHRVYTDNEWVVPPTINIIIEHPDLPAVPINVRLSEIRIGLKVTYGENGVPLLIERVDPPKLVGKIKI